MVGTTVPDVQYIYAIFKLVNAISNTDIIIYLLKNNNNNIT
jgi:hypothetical protein